MNVEIVIGLGFLALLTLGIVLGIAENAKKVKDYGYESEEY